MWGNEFPLWVMNANRDIMSLCLNRPTGCMIDCHWMTNCVCKNKTHPFNNKNMLTYMYCINIPVYSAAVEIGWRCPTHTVGSVWCEVWIVKGLQQAECFWLDGLLKGFRALDWVDRLPHTCHAFPLWWALQLRNQHYYCSETYIFNLWNNDSFAWFMAQGKV